jgi:hypothetical protein
VTDELSLVADGCGWPVEDVVVGAMGVSSSGSLNQTISDASRRFPSVPIAQLSDAMVI